MKIEERESDSNAETGEKKPNAEKKTGAFAGEGQEVQDFRQDFRKVMREELRRVLSEDEEVKGESEEEPEEASQGKEELPDCCKKPQEDDEQGMRTGLIYGLLPHTGCIAFLVFTVLGVTAASALFAPLLANSTFFYLLIALSFGLATISAMVYLGKRGLLSFAGARKKWKYLSTMYGTTASINLVLLFVIFPAVAGAGSNYSSSSLTGASVADFGQNSKITLQVAIPCSGHAPLITNELKKVSGVLSVQFKSPNLFDVTYGGTASKEQILSLGVFKEYPATVVNEQAGSLAASSLQATQPQKSGSGGCGGCGGG